MLCWLRAPSSLRAVVVGAVLLSSSSSLLSLSSLSSSLSSSSSLSLSPSSLSPSSSSALVHAYTAARSSSSLGHASSSRAHVVVVGGGLAGLSAALEAHAAGAHVTLFDKEPRLGGNSAKATSGVNGVRTATQAALRASADDADDALALGADDDDALAAFVDDTLASGQGHSDAALVRRLAARSADAVHFLQRHGVALDRLSRLGGHRHARTHRSSSPVGARPQNVGLEITKALGARLQQLADDSVAAAADSDAPIVRVFNRVRVTSLVTDPADSRRGVLGTKNI